jgi:predicted metal-dependent hydrolase
MTAPPALPYLQGYPPEVLAHVGTLLAERRLLATVLARYPLAHAIRNDQALVGYVAALKGRHLKSAPPLAKVAFDSRLQITHQALGTHTTVSRVQGSRLKAKRELRIASLFKDAPADFLRMIVVHELAHLREREHGKAFYALCEHMAPDYHQLEFDTRLWLTALERPGAAPSA